VVSETSSVKAHLQLALAAAERDEEEEAFGQATLALAQARTAGSAEEEVQAMLTFAGILTDFGRPPEALSTYGKVLALCRAQGDATHEAAALEGRALVYLDKRAQGAAAEDLRAALAIRERLGEPVPLAWDLYLLGALEGRLGEPDLAEAHLRRALELQSTQGAPARADTLGALANVLARRGDLAQAVALREEALALYREARDPAGEGATLAALALLGRRQGRPLEALRLSLAHVRMGNAPRRSWERAELRLHPVTGHLRLHLRRWRDAR